MQIRHRLKKLFVNHWRPKLVCLILAILLWSWVNHFYVRAETDASKEWDENAILFELPE